MRRLLLQAAFAALASTVAQAADKLVILSPHRKSIQDEFIPKFKEYYKEAFKTEVEVDWLDNGGTSDDVKFLRAKFAKNPDTAGVDIFWGGGTATFLDLNREKMLAPLTLPQALAKQIPETAAGVPLFDQTKTWYASAMSSFGVFYNKKSLKFEGLSEPQSWEDLGDAKYRNQITLTDPRHSGTAITMDQIVLQSRGWDKGWILLTRIAANNRTFTHASSDPIKAVVAGDAAASMAIDFYATPKVQDLGKDNLGFSLPKGETILDPDPIAVVRGAPNAKVAERFALFVLSPEAQKLLILPKGTAGGPRLETLGRMSVNTAAYSETEGKRTSEFNPFKQPQVMKLDPVKTARLQRVLTDLIGAVHVDTHQDLKAAWEATIKRGAKEADVAALAKPPVTEAEALALADKWDDNVLRNKKVNSWVEQAKTKYKQLTTKAAE